MRKQESFLGFLVFLLGGEMASLAKIEKWKKERVKVKYKTRYRNRCRICGRPRGYIRDFELCRICFRQLAWQGLIPGVKKASW